MVTEYLTVALVITNLYQMSVCAPKNKLTNKNLTENETPEKKGK
jgi:hypothetical protein